MSLDLFGQLPVAKTRADDWPDDFEDVFWEKYPRKRDKIFALRCLSRVRKSGVVTWAKLIGALDLYVQWIEKTKEPIRFVKYPASWLNAGGWDDKLPAPDGNGRSFFSLAMGDGDGE